MLNTRFGLLIALACLLSAPLVANAGFNEAVAAFQSKNFPVALSEARQLADAGDARGNFLLGVMYQNGLGVTRDSSAAASHYDKAAQGHVAGAYSKLAQMYMRGDGVERNPDKALSYARQSDQVGDPEGSLLLSVMLNAGPLSYLDANNKPDSMKYKKLAERPVSERSLDIEAKDALYRSAARNYPLAQMMLALTLGGTVGDDNLQRMLALVDKLPSHNNQALKNYEKIARYMGTLGKTNTSPQLFYDAQPSQMLAGMIQTCGIRDPKETAKLPPPELKAIAISRPISNAVYLPSKVAGNEHTFLVAGEWEERWTYRACDKTADVIITFKADGMGGATFMSSQRAPKPDAGTTTSNKL